MSSVIPADGLIFIHAHPVHCKVARFKTLGGPYFEVQPAANWQGLEPEARAEAERQVGALTEDEYLPCPPELAARATW